MTAYWWYILKVCICLNVFYLFFIIVLRNSTFFLLNRIYLVTGLLLSFVIPILKISIFKGQSNFLFSTIIETTMFEPEYDLIQFQNLSNGVIAINYSLILSVIYFTGISILFFKLLFSILRIIRIKNNSETYQLDKLLIVKMNLHVPFSFFNMIFLPKDKSNPMIIEHEMAHIKQFHWFDLIFAEIAAVLLWFNPFVVLYKSSLKLQHEYLADSSVVKEGRQIEKYLDCIFKRIQIVSSFGLVSHFYCKTIKKRIVMITKNKTSVKYLGVYLLFVPLLCLLLLAFTNKHHKAVLTGTSANVLEVDGYVPSIYPVDITKVTKISGYGERIHPIYKIKKMHTAIDFAVPEGEEIFSTAKGIVDKVELNYKGYGVYLIIKHDDVYSTLYAHLSKISVNEGASVDKGQVIGCSGHTGLSTEPHLHYEVIKNGKKVNPKDYLPK